MIKVGTIVGDRYEILERIGVGGMAEVFKGKDHKLNRFVAVKVLKEEFRENDAFVKKFKEEAQAAAGLAHPNIVNVYDVGDENGIYYIVMELVEGITLKNYIERKGRLTVKEATSIAIQVSSGLAVAHGNNIVHRDIKPQNIIISREGKVKVTDFGIAKATTSQTTTSNAMGSVHYASPEQARGGYVDHRSDIYSLGVVLYEMVTGRVPFDGETAVTVAVKHLQDDLVPPSKYCEDLPYSLEQIIIKCMRKSPDRRYQDIEDLQADLKQSLVDPEGDFVKKIDLDEQGKTVVASKKTTSKVREARKIQRVELEPLEEEEEDDAYDDEEDEDDDEELSPAIEKIMTIAGVVLAVIIVVVMLMFVSKLLGVGGKSKNEEEQSQNQKIEEVQKEDGKENSTNENTVVVPSLLGMTTTEAKIELEGLGLKLTMVGSEDSSEYTAGQIIRQDVEVGTRIDVGETIKVVTATQGSGTSNGGSSNTSQQTPEPQDTDVKVPNVTNSTESVAKAALEAVGLTVGTVSESASDIVEKGLVISQSLQANSTVKKGSTINLVLSSGPSKVKVTDVLGHEVNRAKGELEADGFKVKIQESYHEWTPGLVVAISPDRGTMVTPGSEITITVSKGVQKITIPTVSVGMTFEAAKDALEAAGFKGTIREGSESSTSTFAPYVTRFSPSGSVEVNGEVTIYVSTTPAATPTPTPTSTPTPTPAADPSAPGA